MGSTAPSRIGLRNLFECQAVASGPVSASPSPTTQATMRSGLSSAMPYPCDRRKPRPPASWRVAPLRARARAEDYLEVLFDDQPVEVGPHERQRRARTPVPEQPELDVLG